VCKHDKSKETEYTTRYDIQKYLKKIHPFYEEPNESFTEFMKRMKKEYSSFPIRAVLRK
jgi:hypothetical protein